MPRQPRFVLPAVVHHVVARGVNKCALFQNGFEKDRYLKRFALVAQDEKVLIHGYCLMNNHVHWLLTPTTARGLARLFQRVHTWWALVYNRKHERSGHLFQSRYHSVPLDEPHYWEALRYVELNPLRAGLVRKAADWQHSSARVHLAGNVSDAPVTLVPVLTRRHYSSAGWQVFLGDSPAAIEPGLLAASAACRPWGDPEWIIRLERTHHRRLTPLPPGRTPGRQNTISAA